MNVDQLLPRHSRAIGSLLTLPYKQRQTVTEVRCDALIGC